MTDSCLWRSEFSVVIIGDRRHDTASSGEKQACMYTNTSQGIQFIDLSIKIHNTTHSLALRKVHDLKQTKQAWKVSCICVHLSFWMIYDQILVCFRRCFGFLGMPHTVGRFWWRLGRRRMMSVICWRRTHTVRMRKAGLSLNIILLYAWVRLVLLH